MVPPLISIVSAVVVALMSSVIMKKTGGSPIRFLSGSQQDRAVLFTLSRKHREILLRGPECSEEEFNSVFGSLAGKIRETFDREGYVVIRGLIDNELMESLGQAGEVLVNETKQGATFTSMEFGPVFLSPPREQDSTGERNTKNLKAFREVSLSSASAVPAFVAKMLFDLDNQSTKTVRILKDVFLAKGKEGEYCGWHVDDIGFWPTSARASPGVNAWIAMDDIPPVYGGGLAVSPRSHNADWRHEAYQIIGSTPTHPEEGYENAKDVFANVSTCNMAKMAPKLASRLDNSRHEFRFRKGDVLFHTRWLFHRSMPMTKKGILHFQKLGEDPTIKRYSIRYEMGDAKLLQGFSMEASVILTPENGGKSLDQVCSNDAPWYPKCWPEVDEEESGGMQRLVEEKMPEAQALKRELMQELAPIFQKK